MPNGLPFIVSMPRLPMNYAHIPIPPADMIRHYAALLHRMLPGSVVGSYLHGSIALDAFDARMSDIDVLTVLADEPSADQIRLIRALHRELRRYDPWGARFEGVYVPAQALGVRSTAPSHLYIQRGRPRGRHRLDPVARLLVRTRGITVTGESAGSVIPETSPEEIREEMARNLTIYWSAQARRPYLFLVTEVVDFAVSTLPRIHHTLRTGELIGKPQAVMQLRDREWEWKNLVDDVAARITGNAPRRALGGMSRAIATTRFIRAMIEEGNAYLRGV